MTQKPPPIAPWRDAGPAAIALAIGLSGPAAAQGPAPPADPVWAARAGASLQPGLQPPFFPSPRDRGTLELELRWRAAERAWVRARLDALRWDRGPQDQEALGSGDLRLGTGLQLGPEALRGELQVEVKLPNADDERQLGSDETDLALLLGLLSRPGPLAVDLHVGVDLRGDPQRTVHQDPVALLQAALATQVGPLSPRLRLLTELPTSLQPGRAELRLGLEGACPWLLGGEGLLGLTSAGPGLGGRIWLGFGAGCEGPRASSPPDDSR